MIDLSTKDAGQGPKNSLPYIVLEPPKRKQPLYTKDTTADFILSPKSEVELNELHISYYKPELLKQYSFFEALLL